jgi:hypothetical protein
MRHLLILTLSVFISACAGKIDYVRPTAQVTPFSNVKTVDRPREAVWNTSVPELSKQFFVINNLDKSSGLMNISYTGDPERYIDCGRITSYVKNVRGERTYDFAGAKAQQTFEILNPSIGLFVIDRRMNLEGRVNLVFEEVGPNATRVTANTRYVATRAQVGRNAANNFPQTSTDSISFNSGGGASFPPNAQGNSTECVSTGALEREILSAIK